MNKEDIDLILSAADELNKMILDENKIIQDKLSFGDYSSPQEISQETVEQLHELASRMTNESFSLSGKWVRCFHAPFIRGLKNDRWHQINEQGNAVMDGDRLPTKIDSGVFDLSDIRAEKPVTALESACKQLSIDKTSDVSVIWNKALEEAKDHLMFGGGAGDIIDVLGDKYE